MMIVRTVRRAGKHRQRRCRRRRAGILGRVSSSRPRTTCARSSPGACCCPLSVRETDAALGLLEDLLAIELLLARDVLATAPVPPVLGAGTAAVLLPVEAAIAAADPYPDAVHRALRERFPDHPVTRDR